MVMNNNQNKEKIFSSVYSPTRSVDDGLIIVTTFFLHCSAVWSANFYRFNRSILLFHCKISRLLSYAYLSY
jgi:hypothetical protein